MAGASVGVGEVVCGAAVPESAVFIADCSDSGGSIDVAAVIIAGSEAGVIRCPSS